MKLKHLASKIFLSLLVLFQGLSVLGCTQTFPLGRIPDSFIFIEYSHGSVYGQSKISRGDPVYDALFKIIHSNQKGWAPDINTYAPLLYFKSELMTINCTENSMVINYKPEDREQWKQLSKSIHGCKATIISAQAKGSK
ncbi:MAG: hypothetical protein M0T70_01040 [Geobacteraceae bacterium]|nr:hypothetical protein [Geobacteraceae bacterium]